MAAILELYRATVGDGVDSKEYFFLGRPGTFSGDVATACGIVKATATEQDQPAISVAALLGKGLLFRIIASYTAAGKRKTVRLLCTKTKLGTILDTLDGKSFNGGTLSAVRFPRRSTFY
jgi:hypothetical protein